MRISDWFLRLAVIAALIGMTMGVVMGATHDFTLSPVHAHINLLGWVSMLLYGLFYRSFPEAAATRAAAIHFWVAVIGVVLMVPSLALSLLQMGGAAPTVVLAASSVVVLVSMLIFAWIVFQATGGRRGAAGVAAEQAGGGFRP